MLLIQAISMSLMCLPQKINENYKAVQNNNDGKVAILCLRAPYHVQINFTVLSVGGKKASMSNVMRLNILPIVPLKFDFCTFASIQFNTEYV